MAKSKTFYEACFEKLAVRKQGVCKLHSKNMQVAH